MKVELRNDDILLHSHFTPPMRRALSEKSFFEHFKETDKIFEEYNVPSILAVLAEGIPHYPEWVDYIKKRLHRFRIDMHGYTHINFSSLPEKEGEAMLVQAKEEIEKAFGVKITRWYVPFGWMHRPEWGERVCDRLGIKFNQRGGKFYHIYFHYWNPKDVKKITKMIASGNHKFQYE